MESLNSARLRNLQLPKHLALNMADNTDAKLQIFTEVFESAGDKMEWLGFNRMLDSNIRQTYGTRFNK